MRDTSSSSTKPETSRNQASTEDSSNRREDSGVKSGFLQGRCRAWGKVLVSTCGGCGGRSTSLWAVLRCDNEYFFGPPQPLDLGLCSGRNFPPTLISRLSKLSYALEALNSAGRRRCKSKLTWNWSLASDLQVLVPVVPVVLHADEIQEHTRAHEGAAD